MKYCEVCRGPLREGKHCKGCWLAEREREWDRRRHVAFYGTRRKDVDGVAREAAIDAAALAYAEAVIVAKATYETRQRLANDTDASPATNQWLPDGSREPLGLIDRICERGDRFGPLEVDHREWREIRDLIPREVDDFRVVAALNRHTTVRWQFSQWRQTVDVAPGPISTWRPSL